MIVSTEDPMSIDKWKKEILTIPNLLSFFRIFLIPVYISIYHCAQNASDYYLAAGVLTVSCLTDLIDGKIARQFNMVTTFGKILDPLADKATQFTLILCLAGKYRCLWYLVAIFVLKESFQLIAGAMSFRRGKILTGALISGKICTTVLFLSLILLVIFPNLSEETVLLVTVADICFMLDSFGNYLFTYFSGDTGFESIDTTQKG